MQESSAGPAGMSLYDEIRHAEHRFLYVGHDPAVCALSIKSVLQWRLGHPTQGIQSEGDAIDLARRLHIYRRWLTHSGLCASPGISQRCCCIRIRPVNCLRYLKNMAYPRRAPLLWFTWVGSGYDRGRHFAAPDVWRRASRCTIGSGSKPICAFRFACWRKVTS